MIFTATRFENSAMIRCEADNIVMRNEMDKPLHEFLNLEVMCKNEKHFHLFFYRHISPSPHISFSHFFSLWIFFLLFSSIEMHEEIKLKI